MMNRLRYGIRRYKRLAKFANRKKMEQTVRASRPGTFEFGFRGDFPEMADRMAVETTADRRQYTNVKKGHKLNHSVDGQMRENAPPFSDIGVHRNVAILLLVAWAFVLGAVLIVVNSSASNSAKLVSYQVERMEMLTTEYITLQGSIASRSSGVNVRQEAGRLGLISPQNSEQKYVSVPDAAVINPDVQGLRLDMASIFGQ